MNRRNAAKRITRVLKQRLPLAGINGPSRRIEDAWVSRETKGAFDNGIAIVIDGGLDQKWIIGKAGEIIRTIRREPSLNRARKGVHIWIGDNVSRRYRTAKWWEKLSAMDPAEVQEGSLEALNAFVRTSGADQIIVLTRVEKLINSDECRRLPANKLSVIFPAEEGERDIYKIHGIPCFGVHEDQVEQAAQDEQENPKNPDDPEGTDDQNDREGSDQNGSEDI